MVCGLSGAPLSSGTLKNLEVLIDGSVPFVWPLRELAYGAIRGLISPQSVQCSVFIVVLVFVAKFGQRLSMLVAWVESLSNGEHGLLRVQSY